MVYPIPEFKGMKNTDRLNRQSVFLVEEGGYRPPRAAFGGCGLHARLRVGVELLIINFGGSNPD
ncbi:MAG: hypothetical protein J6Q14_03240 [Oscillospiraceae bacterium]|nr:hypothetical protein [Oscillospiraceae bacterium]